MNFGYMSDKEAARKLNLTERWIQQFCKDVRVDGAMRFGTQGIWLIPIKWIDERLAFANELHADNNS